MSDGPRSTSPSLKRNVTRALVLRHAILIAVASVMALPFVWMVLTSLMPIDQVGRQIVPSSVPMEQTRFGDLPANYVNVTRTDHPDLFERGVKYWLYYGNSLLVAAWVTFLQVLTSAMAAFAFSRLRWKGRDAVFLMYLGTMMLPGIVMMIPNFQIMIWMRLVDTLSGLVIPGAFGAFGTFLLRQFMLTIPTSLDEAARIDGASNWRLFWEIIMPLSRSGLITLAIFTFIGTYQSLFWPLIMLKSEVNYTLPIGMLAFEGTRGSATHLLMAAVTMSIVPMVVLFVVLQKYLVRGIQLGAVKG